MKVHIKCGVAVAALLSVTTAVAASKCGLAPYTVEMKDYGGEVRANLWDGALKNIQRKTDGGLTAVAGGALVRTAYSGSMAQSTQQLMRFYACRIREQIEIDVKDPAAKATALRQLESAQMVMTERLSDMLDPDVLNSLSEKQKQRELLRNVTRRADDPTIDLKIFDKALADIKEDMFIRSEMKSVYASAELPGVANIGACGGALRDVIASTTGPIQIGLADFRANFRYMVDGSAEGMRWAFQNIFLHAVQAAPVALPARDYASIFKNCSAVEAGVKQVKAAAVGIPEVQVDPTTPGPVPPVPVPTVPVTAPQTAPPNPV